MGLDLDGRDLSYQRRVDYGLIIISAPLPTGLYRSVP